MALAAVQPGMVLPGNWSSAGLEKSPFTVSSLLSTVTATTADCGLTCPASPSIAVRLSVPWTRFTGVDQAPVESAVVLATSDPLSSTPTADPASAWPATVTDGLASPAPLTGLVMLGADGG
jgi:hypothetical protein